MLHWRSGSPRDLVTVETTGSSPVCGAMRVQLDGGAAGFEPVGWEFESLYPRHLAVVKTEITRLCEGRAPGSIPGSEARADDARLVEHRRGKADHNGFDSHPRLLCLRSSMDRAPAP